MPKSPITCQMASAGASMMIVLEARDPGHAPQRTGQVALDFGHLLGELPQQ